MSGDVKYLFNKKKKTITGRLLKAVGDNLKIEWIDPVYVGLHGGNLKGEHRADILLHHDILTAEEFFEKYAKEILVDDLGPEARFQCVGPTGTHHGYLFLIKVRGRFVHSQNYHKYGFVLANVLG